jgi:glycosyltransferase involved in cell wall biosynthesis
MGEARRVESWTEVLRAAGYEPTPVRLLPDHRAGPVDIIRATPFAARSSRGIVPEALAWSVESALREIARNEPAVLVCVSARAYHPTLAEPGRTLVLDFVDRLSVSYRDRASIAPRRAARFVYRLLAGPAGRFERAVRPGVITTAAGWSDAEGLGARWVPNVVTTSTRVEPIAHRFDVVFVGTLSYPPNIDALGWLASVWPRVIAARPGTTMLVAGARPVDRVRDLAALNGWTVLPDFVDAANVLAACSVSVAPLRKASGLQNKVIDAAAQGVAQVISPAAAAGLDPSFPVRVAADDEEFARAVVALLDDPETRAREASAARDHVLSAYSPDYWGAQLQALVSGQPDE